MRRVFSMNKNLGAVAAAAVVHSEAEGLVKTINIIRGLSCLAALVGIATSIATAELYFDNLYESTALTDSFKLARRLLLPHESFFDTGAHYSLFAEVLVCGVHCPAYVYGSFDAHNLGFTVRYDYDSVISIFTLGRIYLLVGFFAELYGFRSAQARVVERFNGVTFDLSFGFRALLDSHPISTVCLVFWSTVLCQAYALRVFERPVCISAVAELIGWCGAGTLGTKDFNQFAVAVWNALITALTIGYGDVFAVTHAGRAIAIMCGISGVIFVALLVNAMSRATALKADERRAFEALQRHHLAVERRKLASDLIKAFYTYVLHKRGVRTMVDLFKRRSVSLATANALSGSPSRDSTSVTTNPLRSGLGVRPHLALHLSTSTSTPNAAGNHPVPHLIMRHLVLVLGRWRRHQRIWHETTRDKDDLDIVKRDVIEVSTRLTELSMHTAAEIDRLTRHIKAQGLQLETVAAGMPGMLSQMRALSDALKVPVTHQMAASSASVDFAAGAAHQSLAPSSDGLDDTVDVAAYEKKHREAALLRRRASMPGGRGSIRPLSPATSESSRSARPLASFGSSAGAVAVGGGGPAPIAGIGVSCTCNCHKVPIGRGKRVAV